MTPPHDDRSLGELFSDLSRDTARLLRTELELAKTELSGKVRAATGHVAVIAAGGVLLHAGLLVLLATMVAALIAFGMAPWLAALIVAVLTMVAGAVMVWWGLRALRTTPLAPVHAVNAMKENTTWTSRTNA